MMENVRRANLYLQQEAVALSHLKCALRNNQLHSEALEKSGVRLEIIPGTPVLIIIESPLPETLEVEIHNNEIYEYSYQRPKKRPGRDSSVSPQPWKKRDRAPDKPKDPKAEEES